MTYFLKSYPGIKGYIPLHKNKMNNFIDANAITFEIQFRIFIMNLLHWEYFKI